MRKKTHIALLTLALLFGTPFGLTELRADDSNADLARALVQGRKILPLEDVLRLNESLIAGHVIGVELEGNPGRYYYELKILRVNGRYLKILVDARSGTPLKRK